MQELGLADAYDLLMHAFVLDKLVERFEAEKPRLIVLGVLQQGHDQRPKQDLDYTRVLLS